MPFCVLKMYVKSWNRDTKLCHLNCLIGLFISLLTDCYGILMQKKLQFNHMLTAAYIDWHIKNSNKKVHQSWQTSALAMHLPLARLVSMPVICCLVPSSSIVILVFYLLLTGISEQHVWELGVWKYSPLVWLTLPLRVTPMNNPITLITNTVAGLHFCCAHSYMRSSANFRIVFSESQNASPLDAKLGPDFNAK